MVKSLAKFHTCKYFILNGITLSTGWAKNGNIFVHLTISPNINRFSKFFYRHN